MRALFQHAYLVTDLERSVQGWSDLFGAGPFAIAPHHRTDEFSYRSETTEADVSYAFGYLGDMMIQLIQQHDDQPSIYRDMYAAGEEGFHHVGYLVHDFPGEKERLIRMGFELACELYADEVNAAYFDTHVNGTVSLSMGAFEVDDVPIKQEEVAFTFEAAITDGFVLDLGMKCSDYTFL